MENENNDSKKVLLSLLVGGVVGAGILYAIHAARHQKTPIMKKIGKTISEVGEMLENCDSSGCSEVIQNIQKKVPKGGDIFNIAADWVNTGLSLWKTLKKG